MALNGSNGTHDTVSRAAAIRAAREANTKTFPLAYSGIPDARVRRLTLQDLIALDAIPTHAQAAVNELIESTLDDEGNAPETLTARELFKRLGGAVAGIRLQTDLATAATIVGFVEPAVVRTEDDITDPDAQVLVTDIDLRDRLAFWEWLQSTEETEAGATAALFPQPAAAAHSRPARESVRADPFGLVTPLRD